MDGRPVTADTRVPWTTQWSRWVPPLRVPLGLRLFFRGVFALLAVATVAMAMVVLQHEKQRAHDLYRDGLRKTQAQIIARLRHPTGQLALLNPRAADQPPTPLRPMVLPFAGIDFDDRTKVQQAVEMAGCQVQYRDGAAMCAAVGHNPYAGGFVYLAGSFASGALVPHARGDLDFTRAHRVRVSVSHGDRAWGWIAPFERLPERTRGSESPGVIGRLTGYVDGVPLVPGVRAVRDFRGWLWQDGRCLEVPPGSVEPCRHRSFVSLRLPVDVLREAIFMADPQRIVWPPPDLARMVVRLQVLAPGDGALVFDSDSPQADPPFALGDLAPLLQPGERLRVRRAGAEGDLVDMVGRGPDVAPSPWIDRLVRRLPVEGHDQPPHWVEAVATPLGRFEVRLDGDLRGLHRSLAAVAARLSWVVGAMLVAVLLAWLAIELRIIGRITRLTRRAVQVSRDMRSTDGAGRIDMTDLGGRDELGVLSRTLQDLLQRVQDDLRREKIRVAQEKDQWHAVGHEIMSPLQSLMALHGAPDDPSRRYVERMQQAVRVLYGQASPSEAFAGATIDPQPLELAGFLGHLVANAAQAGVPDVRLHHDGAPLWVRADEYPLEDVLTHLLRNADRYRVPGSRITLTLRVHGPEALVDIHNQGPPIELALAERMFEYGVRGADEGAGEADDAHRGQGLFVARTYMAKMGGTITAVNVPDGVVFTLGLARAA